MSYFDSDGNALKVNEEVYLLGSKGEKWLAVLTAIDEPDYDVEDGVTTMYGPYGHLRFADGGDERVTCFREQNGPWDDEKFIFEDLVLA